MWHSAEERCPSTLFALTESAANPEIFNADTAARYYDAETVTAIATSGRQFFSYDTYQTLIEKTVWVRDEWLNAKAEAADAKIAVGGARPKISM